MADDVIVPVVVPPVAAVVPPVVEPPPATDPNWLTPRLEREAKAAAKKERAAVMAELGITDPVAAKAALAAAAKTAEDEKALAAKLVERDNELRTTKEKAAALEVTNKEYAARDRALADAELAALTDAQRDAVKVAAGDDAAKTLATIKALRPTWTAVDPKVAAAAAAAAAKAANSAPGRTAPSGVEVAAPDRKAEYAELKVKNPTAAAQYLNKYENEIYPRA